MSKRFHWLRIGCLLLLAGTVQGIMVVRNRVPAQDAVNFLQIARQFDHEPIADSLRRNPQHPLYSMLIWVAHRAVPGMTGTGAASWLFTAQCVAAAAAVLLVVPMYLAGVRLADPTLATGATALFSMLPFTARLGADALSDSTHLCFVLVAFWAATEFLATRRAAWLFACGVAVGIGYLARPEALLLAAAVAATLGVMQLRADWRFPWRQLFVALTLLAGGIVLAAAPYVLVTGKLTPKGSVTLLPGGQSLVSGSAVDAGAIRSAQLSDGRVVATQLNPMLADVDDAPLDFGVRHRPASQRFAGFLPALRELVRELVEGLHYFFGLLVLVGITRSPRRPANLLAAFVGVVFLVVLVLFASRAGYLASRHVLVLVALASYVAARGGWMLACALARLAARVRADASPTRWQLRVATAILVLAGACCTPRNLQLLHPSRAAHVDAGRWLARHAPAGSLVLDSRGWAALYSGLPSFSYHGVRIAVQDDRLAYVVVEQSDLDDERPRGETLRMLLSRAGEKLAEFSAADTADIVLVFRWHTDRLARASTMERAPNAN
jgi:hypothetical protein